MRLTQKNPDGGYSTKSPPEDVLKKLGALEDMYDELTRERDAAAARMEALKAEGKNKTASFKQAMGDKLTLGMLISRFDIYGI